MPRMSANNHIDSMYSLRGLRDSASMDGDTVASSVATEDHVRIFAYLSHVALDF